MAIVNRSLVLVMLAVVFVMMPTTSHGESSENIEMMPTISHGEKSENDVIMPTTSHGESRGNDETMPTISHGESFEDDEANLHEKMKIVNEDEYWQERMKIAEKVAMDTYNPNPSEITNHLNTKIKEVIEGMNSTRRKLGRNEGCLVTNPIDRCWRCNKNWESNRFRLADCAMGFARGVTGGKGGKIYVVNDPSDSELINPKPGTLRHAVIQDGPLWIIFAWSMDIRLQQELMMSSDKTIDGRGANVHIAHGAGITVQYVKNIIIHGLHIHDIVPGGGGMIRDSVNHYGFRTKSDGDGISLFGASKVWIDHVSISNCYDGLVDAIMGSTGVTLSNSHFTKHNEAFLFGASASHTQDKMMQITVAFNHFGQGLVQRMPRVRYGFVHVVNNDYTHWLMYAIGGSNHPTIISQGNRFIAPPNIFAKQVTKRDYAEESEWMTWQWRSEGDIMMNGAFFVQSGQPFKGFTNYFPSVNCIYAEQSSLVSSITRFAGPLDCKRNSPC